MVGTSGKWRTWRRGGRAEEGGFLLHPRLVPSLQTATAIRVPGPGKRDDKRDARGGGKRSLGKGVKARERARNSGGEWTVLGTQA